MTTKDEQLTARQSAFVDYFADPASETFNNQYASAIKANYSPKTAQAACKDILGKPRVKAAVEARRAELQAAMDITREEVVTNARWLVDFGKRKGCGADVKAGNEQLAKLAGLYREDAPEDAPAAPTIVIHMPELPTEGQVEPPTLRLLAGEPS